MSTIDRSLRIGDLACLTDGLDNWYVSIVRYDEDGDIVPPYIVDPGVNIAGYRLTQASVVMVVDIRKPEHLAGMGEGAAVCLDREHLILISIRYLRRFVENGDA